jgi:Uncharacterised nucleotidyltransferase
VLIKGLAVARHYPVAEMRPFGDIDIVVAPGQFDAARRLAQSAGLHPSTNDLQPHPSFDRNCREGVNLADRTGLIRLDLHHHIGPWAFSRYLDFARLEARAGSVVVHGHRVRVADPVHSLAVALLHLISEQWQKKLSLLTWSDIALLANMLDAATTAEEMRALRLDGLLAAVLATLPPGSQPAAIVDALGSPPIPRRTRLRLRLLDTGSVVGRHPASWAARLPATKAVYFLGGSAVPSRAYLTSRFGEEASYARWWALSFGWAKQAARGDDVSSPYSPGRT